MEIAIASANAHKLVEIRAILEPLGFTCLGLDHWPEVGDLAETGDTFQANALQKARALYAVVQRITLADDSGLEVDALGGAPGVHSKRFTVQATAESNNRELLRLLGDTPERRARFRCVAALVGPGGQAVADGTCEGHIGFKPRGRNGFGYDPLFFPDETPGRTMAELEQEEKNRISHRGRAFRQVPRLLSLVKGR